MFRLLAGCILLALSGACTGAAAGTPATATATPAIGYVTESHVVCNVLPRPDIAKAMGTTPGIWVRVRDNCEPSPLLLGIQETYGEVVVKKSGFSVEHIVPVGAYRIGDIYP